MGHMIERKRWPASFVALSITPWHWVALASRTGPVHNRRERYARVSNYRVPERVSLLVPQSPYYYAVINKIIVITNNLSQLH